MTGLSYDRVREIVDDLEGQDILLRTTYPRVILYHNAELRLNAAGKLVEVYPTAASTPSNRRPSCAASAARKSVKPEKGEFPG